MDDATITTNEQLDAALRKQRAARIEKLRRQTRGLRYWPALLVVAGIIVEIWIYFRDGYAGALVQCGILVVVLIVTSSTAAKRRQEAAILLEKEIRGDPPAAWFSLSMNAESL
jgi:hypothetical protein